MISNLPSMQKIFVIVALLCVLFTSCTEEPELVCNAKNYNAITGEKYKEWEDTIGLAEKVTGDTLALRVNELQRIAQEYSDLDIPECYQPAHEKFVSSMNYTLSVYMDMVSDEGWHFPDIFTLADTEYAAGLYELKKLNNISQ